MIAAMAKRDVSTVTEGGVENGTSNYRPNSDEDGEGCTSFVLPCDIIRQPKERASAHSSKI